MLRRLVLICLLLLTALPSLNAGAVEVLLPKQALGPKDLAVIVNDDDPLSVRIGAYYQERRHIPARNMIHVNFEPGHPVMKVAEFKRIKAAVDAVAPKNVQAYALTWAAPYRVGCMSITAAFTFGFDRAYCAKGCKQTRVSPYFNSSSHAPWRDLHIRPTMAIAALDFAHAQQLIDRGVAADGTQPSGTGYLLITSDKARDSRAPLFPVVEKAFGRELNLQILHANFIEKRNDVLFYFTGLAHVPHIGSNRYLPGAMADHLTSSGGQLTNSRQMSALRWLDAGATASYGTVVEPCNYPAKFPNPLIAIGRYMMGETVLEAYWKSVAEPGQGIFIGAPLARPWAGHRVVEENGRWVLWTHALAPGRYLLSSGPGRKGPWRPVRQVTVPGVGWARIPLGSGKAKVFKLTAIHPAQRKTP